MSNKILVTYASRTGSTAEVAQAIGKTLAESGAQGAMSEALNGKRKLNLSQLRA